MKKLVLLTLFATAISFAQQPPTSLASKAKVLSRVELDKFRRPDEIASIGGFPVYLSIQAADIDKHLSEIPKDKLIVLVSNHAGRAGRAAHIQESKGIKLAGAVGAQTYESEGGKLLKIEPPKPA